MKVNKDKIKKERLRRNLSYEGFGELVGVSTLTVYYWENGTHTPNYKNIRKLSETTGQSHEYFYDLE